MKIRAPGARSSLAVRLLGLVLATTVLTGALVGVAAVTSSRQAMRDQVQASSLAAAKLSAEFIAIGLNDETDALEKLAARPEILAALANNRLPDLTKELEQYIESDSNLIDVSVYGPQNRLRVSRPESGMPPDLGFQVKSWMPRLLARGTSGVGPPRLDRSGQAVVNYSMPVHDAQGRSAGFVAAGLSLGALSRALSAFQTAPGASVSLIDRRGNGTVLTHPDPKQVMAPADRQSPALAQLLAGHEGTLRMVTAAGDPVLEAYVRVPNREFPWGVIVTQPEAPIVAPVRAVTWRIVEIVLIVVLLAAAAGAFLTTAILRPLRRLEAASEALASGDLGARVDLPGSDEIGRLGRAFDYMGERLQTTIDSLQIEVRERKRAEEALTQQVLHDGLTGLPNRLLFRDRLEQAIRAAHRDGSTAAILFMDLDNFKPVNDNHGHHVGDILLERIGSRISGLLRGTDTVARIGGDEF
ncbi:MAG: diguanylate cyclase, partial [Chloroflexota bacterium]|nr:diguanylate cyclase [Chloroflexota bacterium]